MISAAAFVFSVWADPMTDEKTWEARIGDDRIGVSILCGAITSGKPAVEFRTGKTLYEFSNQHASIQWRFDDDAPEKRFGNWFEKRATLVGKDAELFIRQMGSSHRLRARFAAAYDGDVEMDTPVNDPQGAIAKVLKACAMQ